MTRPTAANSKSAALAENDFCAGCGICCEGILFGQVPVTEEEEIRLSPLGHDLFEISGRRHFRLPCPSLSQGRCSIYESRPCICRKFSCKLLERYHAGELDPDEGRRRIDEAKALREKVLACEPDALLDGARQTRWRALSAELEAARGDDRKAIGRRLLTVAAFETYLRQWFWERKD